MRPPRLRAGASAAATIAFLAGCATTSSTRPAAPTQTVIVTSPSLHVASSASPHTQDSGNGQVLPIFAYLQSPQDARTIYDAVRMAENHCLERFGFPAMPDEPRGTLSPVMYRRYGITSEVIAAQYGYHLDPAADVIPSNLPAETFSEAEQRVLDGTDSAQAPPSVTATSGGQIPPGGCSGEASRLIEGNAPADLYTLPNNINTNDFGKSESDPKVVAALQDWSTCMANHGYHYSTPLAPPAAFTNSGSAPSATEIAVATTDVECKQSTDLVDRWFTAEANIEEKDIQANIERLNDVRNQTLSFIQHAVAALKQ